MFFCFNIFCFCFLELIKIKLIILSWGVCFFLYKKCEKEKFKLYKRCFTKIKFTYFKFLFTFTNVQYIRLTMFFLLFKDKLIIET